MFTAAKYNWETKAKKPVDWTDINKPKKLVKNRTAVIKHNINVTHSEGNNKKTNGSRSQAMPEKWTMTE